MNLHELSEIAWFNSLRWFPEFHGVDPPMPLSAFLALGMVGEAGEVANVVKKSIRDGVEIRDELASELADVFTYLMILARQENIDLEVAYHEKAQVCEERWGKR